MSATSLDHLKCHMCSDGYVCEPIYPCKRGHLICSECSDRQHCPICWKRFEKTRSYGLEKMAYALLMSCQNRERGCKKMMPPDRIDVHQKHCDFSQRVCLSLVGADGCSRSGTRRELIKHILNEHFAIISDSFKHNFVIQNYSLIEEFSCTVLLTHFSHLFVAKLMYSDSERAFYGGVQFVSGEPQFASEFRYEFEVGKETTDKAAHYKFMYSRQAHTISEDYNDRIISDNCNQFWLKKDVGHFFKDVNDTLTVTVILKSVQSLAMKNAEALTTYAFGPSQYCQRCVSSFNPSALR